MISRTTKTCRLKLTYFSRQYLRIELK